MKIHDVLADKGQQVVTVWPEKRLGDIPRLFDERNIASVVVVDHAGNPLGIVTDVMLTRLIGVALSRPRPASPRVSQSC